jgi:hypothetical protein
VNSVEHHGRHEQAEREHDEHRVNGMPGERVRLRMMSLPV